MWKSQKLQKQKLPLFLDFVSYEMLYKTYPGSVLTYELIEPLLFAKPKLELTLKDEAPPKEDYFPSIFQWILTELPSMSI